MRRTRQRACDATHDRGGNPADGVGGHAFIGWQPVVCGLARSRLSSCAVSSQPCSRVAWSYRRRWPRRSMSTSTSATIIRIITTGRLATSTSIRWSPIATTTSQQRRTTLLPSRPIRVIPVGMRSVSLWAVLTCPRCISISPSCCDRRSGHQAPQDGPPYPSWTYGFTVHRLTLELPRAPRH
jgi:hypothetical protein